MVVYIRACEAVPAPAPASAETLATAEKPIDKMARDVLLKAYTGMFTKAEFIAANVSKKHFKERFDRSRGQKKQKTSGDTSVHDRMRVSAPPGSEDEDDDDDGA